MHSNTTFRKHALDPPSVIEAGREKGQTVDQQPRSPGDTNHEYRPVYTRAGEEKCYEQNGDDGDDPLRSPKSIQPVTVTHRGANPRRQYSGREEEHRRDSHIGDTKPE